MFILNSHISFDLTTHLQHFQIRLQMMTTVSSYFDINFTIKLSITKPKRKL